MKQEITIDSKAQCNDINRAAYILYMILVLFQFATREYDWAIINLGISAIFDPYASIKWKDRTRSQKAWLLIPIAMLIAGTSFLFLR